MRIVQKDTSYDDNLLTFHPLQGGNSSLLKGGKRGCISLDRQRLQYDEHHKCKATLPIDKDDYPISCVYSFPQIPSNAISVICYEGDAESIEAARRRCVGI